MSHPVAEPKDPPPMRLPLAIGTVLVAGSTLLPLFAADPAPPAVPREFRAAWVATVGNIDWPSRKGLPTDRQKDELLAILDTAKDLRLNAIVFQVRPMADAMYASELEPWSEFLTGAIGQAPEPFYDPLAFAIRDAHARGLELHAWFNPYRARVPGAQSPAPDTHLTKSRPDLAKPYGKHAWLNPTHKDVQDHSLKVFLDVVRRYDVDGIHMDDYFYPYAEKDANGDPIPFPDDDTWAAYRKAGGALSRDDWRRDAVNRFVERLYRETKALKPWVKVGISPFGIWRPGHPPGIQGFDQYAGLYADAKLWLNKGWVDYFTPQLYWPIAQEKQSYPRLLAWWAGENSQQRHLWPGLFTSRYPAAEIANQIKVTRQQPGATGHVHFSMKSLMRDKGGVAAALKELYAEPALVPASPWLGRELPAAPLAEWQPAAGGKALTIRPAGDGVRQVVVRSLAGGKWLVQILPLPADGSKPIAVTFATPPTEARVTAVDRTGNESEAAAVGG
jgi:uncharacterized lipoprotein YddW (UPF0748 family)